MLPPESSEETPESSRQQGAGKCHHKVISLSSSQDHCILQCACSLLLWQSSSKRRNRSPIPDPFCRCFNCEGWSWSSCFHCTGCRWSPRCCRCCSAEELCGSPSHQLGRHGSPGSTMCIRQTLEGSDHTDWVLTLLKQETISTTLPTRECEKQPVNLWSLKKRLMGLCRVGGAYLHLLPHNNLRRG